MKKNSVKSLALQIWQLGDTQLPIGRPWFQFWPLSLFHVLRPVAWQGWLVLAALAVWLLASVGFFLWMGWQPSNVFVFGWLMPTMAVWILIVGMKTEARLPWDEVS
jgi:hypothetical protein